MLNILEKGIILFITANLLISKSIKNKVNRNGKKKKKKAFLLIKSILLKIRFFILSWHLILKI